jgi:hypothetical protein
LTGLPALAFDLLQLNPNTPVASQVELPALRLENLALFLQRPGLFSRIVYSSSAIYPFDGHALCASMDGFGLNFLGTIIHDLEPSIHP